MKLGRMIARYDYRTWIKMRDNEMQTKAMLDLLSLLTHAVVRTCAKLCEMKRQFGVEECVGEVE